MVHLSVLTVSAVALSPQTRGVTEGWGRPGAWGVELGHAHRHVHTHAGLSRGKGRGGRAGWAVHPHSRPCMWQGGPGQPTVFCLRVFSTHLHYAASASPQSYSLATSSKQSQSSGYKCVEHRASILKASGEPHWDKSQLFLKKPFILDWGRAN